MEGIPGFTEVTAPIESINPKIKASYDWEFITDSFLLNANTLKLQLIEKLKSNEVDILKVFYEIFISISEYPNRASCSLFINLSSEILSSLNFSSEKLDKINENLIILLSSFNNDNENIKKFIKDCTIDNKFKILYLNRNLLKSEGIFPDFSKYQYNDARNRVFSIDSYSSLHESSEGYSKFISAILSYMNNQNDDFENINNLIDLLMKLVFEFDLDNKRCFLILLNLLSQYFDKLPNLVIEIFRNTIWWRPKDLNSSTQSTIINYLTNYMGSDKCIELKLVTYLIKENILDFDSIYECLKPYDYNEVAKLLEKKQTNLKNGSGFKSLSALAMAAPLLPDSDDENDSNNSKSVINKQVDEIIELSIDEKFKSYWKFDLLEYLIDYKLLDYIFIILSEFPEIPLLSNIILHKLNKLLEELIDEFYYSFVDNLDITGLNEQSNISNMNIDEYLDILNKFLPFIRHKISENNTLMTKIVRIMDKSLKENIKDADFWFEIIQLHIFPSLLFTNNIPLINETFDIIKNNYSIELRYSLYDDYMKNYKKDLYLNYNYQMVEKKTKNILKRMSIENINISCRSLNKIVSINPICSSFTILTNIESYNSLIELICESSKFFNDYSWDVITYQILNKLSSNKNKIQNDGINYSQWYVNICQLIGKLSKLYTESFQLSPILKFIDNNLMINDFNIIYILKELIDSMTGIKSNNNLTIKQILRLNSGQSLRELVYFAINDNREYNFKSSNKLLKTLIENNLLNELIIILCQMNYKLIEIEDEKPLKFINERIDDINSLIHNLIIIIIMNLKSDEFEERIYSVNELVNSFNIEIQWVFEIWRKNLLVKFYDSDIYTPIRETFQEKVDFEKMNVEFFSIFWTLSLYDINFNDISYSTEEEDLNLQIKGVQLKLRRVEDLNEKEVKSLEDQYSKLNSIVKYIKIDKETHETNYNKILDKIENEKDKWFNNGDEEELLHIFEKCIIPRFQQSSFDAIFVGKFLFFINSVVNVKNYSLKNVLDLLFNTELLPITLFTNTTIDTENLALFYQIVLERLNNWWSDEEIFNKENKNFENYKDFKEIYFNWQVLLLNQIIKTLNSKSYTSLNNIISFLKVIMNNYPVIKEHSEILYDKLNEIIENDDREDIKLSSRALIGLIKFQDSKYVPIWEFYEMKEEDKLEAIKKRDEKNAILKAKEDEEKENERQLEKERELVNKPVAKPYGLVGLKSRVKKVEEKVEENSEEKVEEKVEQKTEDEVNDTKDDAVMPDVGDDQKVEDVTVSEDIKDESNGEFKEESNDIDEEKGEVKNEVPENEVGDEMEIDEEETKTEDTGAESVIDEVENNEFNGIESMNDNESIANIEDTESLNEDVNVQDILIDEQVKEEVEKIKELHNIEKDDVKEKNKLEKEVEKVKQESSNRSSPRTPVKSESIPNGPSLHTKYGNQNHNHNQSQKNQYQHNTTSSYNKYDNYNNYNNYNQNHSQNHYNNNNNNYHHQRQRQSQGQGQYQNNSYYNQRSSQHSSSSSPSTTTTTSATTSSSAAKPPPRRSAPPPPLPPPPPPPATGSTNNSGSSNSNQQTRRLRRNYYDNNGNNNRKRSKY